MSDPRTIILNSISISEARIEFSKQPIVLLCGGAVPVKNNPDDPDPPIKSFRHALSKSDSRYEFFRPEERVSWQNDGIFKNLMDYEADLAGICSLVVIVLESPGSIAELGAFSQLKDLSKKIIVINSSDFDESTSFINLGILRLISEKHPSSIKSYPWSIPRLNENPLIPMHVVEDAIRDISEELDELPKSQTFKAEKNSHIIALIYEIINIFVALKEVEIHEYLEKLSVTLQKEELRSKLFLLEEFRIIRKIRYSDKIFYCCIATDYHRVRMPLKDKKHIDYLRITMDCRNYYRNTDSERHRNRAISQAFKDRA